MADMRTRAGPESSATSIESPSLTLVTVAASTGSGLGGSAAKAAVVNTRTHKQTIFLCMAGGLAQPGGKKTFAVRGVAGEGLQRTLQEGCVSCRSTCRPVRRRKHPYCYLPGR